MDLELLLKQLKEKPVIHEALHLLATKLPSSLKYHVASHTDDVLHDVVLFSLHDGLSEREIELLAVAAAFHDTGFTHQARENEALGAEIAQKLLLKDPSYSKNEVAQIVQMILDTQLKFLPEGPRQVPSTPLAGYLLDADVSNLGRDDFFQKTELYRAELGKTKEEYLPWLIRFLDAHKWYSPAANKLRGPTKEKNIRKAKRMAQEFFEPQE